VKYFIICFESEGEGIVYFNIRGEGSVIQTSLRGEECNSSIFEGRRV